MCDYCLACTDSERYDEHIHCNAEHTDQGCGDWIAALNQMVDKESQ